MYNWSAGFDNWSDNAFLPTGWFWYIYWCKNLPDGWRCMTGRIMRFCPLNGFVKYDCRVQSFKDLAGWTESVVFF